MLTMAYFFQGFGGTNAHTIIESYESSASKSILSGPVITPFVFSAASESSLRSLLNAHKEYLSKNSEISLRDFAWTLYQRRSTLPYRTALSASHLQDLISKIDDLLSISKKASVDLTARYVNKPNAKILGVFTGQGAQWPRMGAKLIELSPLVSEYVEQLDASLKTLPTSDRPSWTIRDELLAFTENSRLAQAEISQPLCTAVQIILVNLLRLAHIKLTSVVGHSSGEIGAAYASGLITAESAIRIAYYRGQCAKLARSPSGQQGGMMAVGTTMEDAYDFCKVPVFRGRLQVAASNSPSSVTISGDESAINEAIEIFKDEKKFVRKLKVDTAYHSHHMQSCTESYLHGLSFCDETEAHSSGSNWHSSVLPGQVMGGSNLSRQYWVDNMTNPVLFSSAITHAVQADGPFDMILEVGPHPALQGPCTTLLEEMGESGIPYSGLLDRKQDDIHAFSSAIGSIWTHLGRGNVNFDSLDREVTGFDEPKCLVTGLPLYPFNHTRTSDPYPVPRQPN
jgi:Polyketide synthase modules and related proteins